MQRPEEGLNLFYQFGYFEQSRAGAQSIGRCPFCGKDGHFYVNTEAKNKTWDCKRCGKAGGYKTFAESIVDHCADNFTGEAAKKLSKQRGISAETFASARAGFHPVTGLYTLPVFSPDGDDLLNIKLYDLHTFRNAAGMSAAMYGTWFEKFRESKDIIICEGEWDTLAMLEIIEALQLKDTWAIGVPGAGTFKPQIIPAFNGKNVYLAYDNDEAGKNGMEKATALLSPVARKVMTVVWPEGTKSGFDLRDLYVKQNRKNAAQTWSELMGMMEVAAANSGRRPAEADVVNCEEPIPCEEVYAVFKKWLHLPDTTLLDVIFGTVLANRMTGEPVWMFIVAPPGATKTEPLMGLAEGPRIATISTLTPHTLISGASLQGGADPSLIPQLDGKVLIVKDFTAVLGLPSTEREEIFSILRDAYDGECQKPFGNGIVRKHKSKFGIIAAVTPMIEMFTEDHAALGERFLRWRNFVSEKVDDRDVFIQKAMSNIGKEDKLREELRAVSHTIIKAKYTVAPNIPKAAADQLIAIAGFIAELRGTVHRDRYTQEITHRSFSELGTRLAKQLFKLMTGIGMFKQKEMIDQEEIKIALHIAKSSIPHRLFEAMECLVKLGACATTSDVSAAIGLSTTTATKVLENLTMLRAAVKVKDESGKICWGIHPEMKKLIKRSKIFGKVAL